MNHMSQQPGCQPKTPKQGHANKNEEMRGEVKGREMTGINSGWKDGGMDEKI